MTASALHSAIADRLARSPNLPTVPRITLELIELGEQEEITPEALAATAAKDPALTAKLLQAANSPRLVRSRGSTTLREAALTLGTNAFLSLALSFSLVNGLSRSRPNSLDYTHFWRRSVVAASAARRASERTAAGRPGTAMLAGLVQDLGMLALDAVVPGPYARINARATTHEDLHELEQRYLGTDHAELGRWLLEQWQMPAPLAAAAGASHSCKRGQLLRNAPEPAHQPVASAVAVSNQVADLWLVTERGPAMQRAVALGRELFGWSNEEIRQLLLELADQINGTLALYDVATLSEEEIDRAASQAEELLTACNLSLVQHLDEERSSRQSLELERSALQQEAELDPLTQIRNRRGLEEELARLRASAVELDQPLTVAMVDIDSFKAYNDLYGHQACDRMIRNVARKLANEARQLDRVVRYGGEEFLLVLPGMGRGTAERRLEQMRGDIAALTHPLTTGEAGISLTISIGYTTLEGAADERSSSDLIRDADQALYAAKRNGRNRVEPDR